jgi:ketosteroid isomerase-like protein
MGSAETFEQAIDASHAALDAIARGDPEAFFDLYSRGDDATLANPYGPPARGFADIEVAGRRAAANYRDGRAVEFETFAKFATGELGYMLEIERFETKVAGAGEISKAQGGPLAGDKLRTASAARRISSSLSRPLTCAAPNASRYVAVRLPARRIPASWRPPRGTAPPLERTSDPGRFPARRAVLRSWRQGGLTRPQELRRAALHPRPRGPVAPSRPDPAIALPRARGKQPPQPPRL